MAESNNLNGGKKIFLKGINSNPLHIARTMESLGYENNYCLHRCAKTTGSLDKVSISLSPHVEAR